MTDDRDADRDEIARLVLGDPKLAPLVSGDTAKEMAAHAAEVGRLLREVRASQRRPPPADFDGGVRQPLPGPGPTHEQWLSELLMRTRPGDGTGWG